MTTSGWTSGTMASIGDFIGFSVAANTAGTYTITTDAPTPTVQILLDNVLVGIGSWTGPISAGIHGIRLCNTSPAGTTVNNLIVTQASAGSSARLVAEPRDADRGRSTRKRRKGIGAVV
ncbi:MAG: hypothetical protein WDN69_15970 [Aliidongia sp.]